MHHAYQLDILVYVAKVWYKWKFEHFLILSQLVLSHCIKPWFVLYLLLIWCNKIWSNQNVWMKATRHLPNWFTPPPNLLEEFTTNIFFREDYIVQTIDFSAFNVQIHTNAWRFFFFSKTWAKKLIVKIQISFNDITDICNLSRPTSIKQ